MPKSKPSPIRAAKVDDPEGDRWHGTAATAWDAAGGDIERFDAPALPAFTAPAFVTRDLLGRFLLDRDTLVVHDAQSATEACALDRIANGTWYHFWREVPDDAGAPCGSCIPGE